MIDLVIEIVFHVFGLIPSRVRKGILGGIGGIVVAFLLPHNVRPGIFDSLCGFSLFLIFAGAGGGLIIGIFEEIIEESSKGFTSGIRSINGRYAIPTAAGGALMGVLATLLGLLAVFLA